MTTQANAKSTITFAIPVNQKHLGVPSKAGRAIGYKPAFISGNSDGNITFIFDTSTSIVVPFAPANAPTPTSTPIPGPSGSVNLPGGGTFSYTSQFVADYSGGNQEYAVVDAAYTTIPGTHTLGVVQTNGACQPDTYGRELCIPNTVGFVLAEGQTTLNLQPGTNPTTTLTLQGVMQSAYLCDAACDGQAGVYTSGFNIQAFASDESGDAISYQSNGGVAVPYDNGSFQLVETDGLGIVTISNPGPFSVPNATNADGGENFTITCSQVGTTTVAAELLSSDQSQGSVSGFTYTAQNYPQAGSTLSSVGADEYFGNTLAVNCTSTDVLTIN
jgi:hypothetical protein